MVAQEASRTPPTAMDARATLHEMKRHWRPLWPPRRQARRPQQWWMLGRPLHEMKRRWRPLWPLRKTGRAPPMAVYDGAPPGRDVGGPYGCTGDEQGAPNSSGRWGATCMRRGGPPKGAPNGGGSWGIPWTR
jgi:hypothetical protein